MAKSRSASRPSSVFVEVFQVVLKYCATDLTYFFELGFGWCELIVCTIFIGCRSTLIRNSPCSHLLSSLHRSVNFNLVGHWNRHFLLEAFWRWR